MKRACLFRSDSVRTILGLPLSLVFLLVFPAYAQSLETVLYRFQGATDGAYPLGRMIRDSAGNLYGATKGGGSSECWSALCGTVYQLTPPQQPGRAWAETVLHIFQGHST